MTPVALAALHARCFTAPRPWTPQEFADYLASPRHLVLAEAGAALAVLRIVAGEAELLTIATDPDHRGRGLATRLLARVLAGAARRGAARLFLEVAADNAPALALYRAAGFSPAGRRRGYYRRDGAAVDALLMERALSPG